MPILRLYSATVQRFISIGLTVKEELSAYKSEELTDGQGDT